VYIYIIIFVAAPKKRGVGADAKYLKIPPIQKNKITLPLQQQQQQQQTTTSNLPYNTTDKRSVHNTFTHKINTGYQ
jgi:hypothetical protein